nr:retrovirus-related Pol polyprotein from transposon TNT 1-94 [Tanacetum cinerariifolium]
DLKSFEDDGFKPSGDDEKKVDEDPSKGSACKDQEKQDTVNSTNNVNTVSLTINAVGTNEDYKLPFDLDMPVLEDIGTFDFLNEDKDDDSVADMNNLDTTIQVSPTPTTTIHKDHPLDHVIGELQSATQTRNMSKNLEEHVCPVTILNTKDHLGKFNGKADEVFFVGYSMNSKAFRVFNSRERIVEENLHLMFSENTPNVVGSRLDWLFDIDALTRIINYKPIDVGTQSNSFAGTKASDNAGQARKETEPLKDYILLPLWTADPPFFQDLKSFEDDGFKPSGDDEKKVEEDPSKGSACKDQEKQDNVNITNNVNTVSLTINAVGINEDYKLPFDLDMPVWEDIGTFDFLNEDKDDDSVADMNNLDTTIQVSPTPTTRIHKDHPLDHVIGELQSAT